MIIIFANIWHCWDFNFLNNLMGVVMFSIILLISIFLFLIKLSIFILFTRHLCIFFFLQNAHQCHLPIFLFFFFLYSICRSLYIMNTILLPVMFFHFCELSFYSLNSVFEKRNLLILMKYKLPIFTFLLLLFLVSFCLCVLFKKAFSMPMSRRCPSMLGL